MPLQVSGASLPVFPYPVQWAVVTMEYVLTISVTPQPFHRNVTGCIVIAICCVLNLSRHDQDLVFKPRKFRVSEYTAFVSVGSQFFVVTTRFAPHANMSLSQLDKNLLNPLISWSLCPFSLHMMRGYHNFAVSSLPDVKYLFWSSGTSAFVHVPPRARHTKCYWSEKTVCDLDEMAIRALVILMMIT